MNKHDKVPRFEGIEHLSVHGFLPGECIAITGVTSENSGLLSRVLGQIHAKRALIISPVDEEVALQLLESLRRQGIEADIINNHPELQTLKEAWGGFDFNGTPEAWKQKIETSIGYVYSSDEACYDPDDQQLIKAGRMAPKHHMHLNARGIPKRGRNR